MYGRIVPLSGTQYVDLIFHYRPLQPELWYLEENPDDSIPPLGEISDCHEEVITEILQEPGNPSGDPADISFSTTICTEVKTGKLVDLPFLSPSFTRIESGNDLYQFWHTLHGTTGQTSEPTIIGE